MKTHIALLSVLAFTASAAAQSTMRASPDPRLG